MNVLIIIPARGGSKGIPRKNLRLLGGKPLIYYTISKARKSTFSPDIYVTSEDDEILSTSIKFGVKGHKRDEKLADDETTLDPVIYDCYRYASEMENKIYSLIITIQPTSPLLKTESIDKAIDKMITNTFIDTIISAKDSTHLTWGKKENKYYPLYDKRLNRQYLRQVYTETGAFLITRNNIITKESRIGSNVDLVLLERGEEIDIDTYEDWSLCQYYLNKKKILFVVRGNNQVGLGHVYNTLLVANDILNHEVIFLVTRESELAMEIIQSKNYPVSMQLSENIITDIDYINPDIIINDILDTDKNYIRELKVKNYTVINFEDLGNGSQFADLVINAIYPEEKKVNNQFFGQDYFILRDEFIFSKEKTIKNEVSEVLITFGGVDPNNYTKKVIRAINEFCNCNNINITVITGFGYEKFKTLEEYNNVNIIKNISNISDYILKADLIFTSAGRTIYEVASINTPAIVLEQNERESTHFFASKTYGFSNLGLGYEVSDEDLLKEFLRLTNSLESRKEMSELMKNQDLKSGRSRVQKLIQGIIQG